MKDDGGPAYPVPGPTELPSNGIITDAYGGMSLRDYFAGQALAGMCAFPESSNGSMHDNCGEAGGLGIASLAYRYADAMLSARKATGGDGDV